MNHHRITWVQRFKRLGKLSWFAPLLCTGLGACADIDIQQPPIENETSEGPADPDLGELLSVETFSYRDSANYPLLAEENQPLVTVELHLFERGVRVHTTSTAPTLICDENQWVAQADEVKPMVADTVDDADWTYRPWGFNGCEELLPDAMFTADIHLEDRMGIAADQPFTLAYDERNENAIWQLPSEAATEDEEDAHGPPDHSNAGGNGNGNGQGNGPPDHSNAGGNGNANAGGNGKGQGNSNAGSQGSSNAGGQGNSNAGGNGNSANSTLPAESAVDQPSAVIVEDSTGTAPAAPSASTSDGNSQGNGQGQGNGNSNAGGNGNGQGNGNGNGKVNSVSVVAGHGTIAA